ncbi:putative reverse transcriptase domain-containing protein [Tanacetum coccineum]
MNRGFLDSRRWNNNHRKKANVDIGIDVVTEPYGMMNDVNPRVDASAAKEDGSPYVVVLSYANVTSKLSGKKLNFHTLFTPGDNGIDVVVPLESIRAISERFANTTYGFFLRKKVAYPVVANYVRNTWGKYGLVRSMFSSSTEIFSIQFSSMDGLIAMLENGPWFIQNNPLILKKWHPNENLLKEDVSNVLVWVKLHGVPVTAFSEDGLSAIATKLGTPLMLDSYTSDMCMQSWGGHYICNVRVEYEWKPHRCASCKVFGHIHEECPKNIGAGEKKTMKKPSQTSRGVPVGLKMGFKPQKEYRLFPKSLLLVLAVIRIKVWNLLLSGKAIIVDKDGNPLKKVEFSSEYDSEDEVASVDNDMARSMASERVGFGTQSLLEQWRDSYGNGDYDDDPYDDDDMYECQDLSHELQAICDNLDIRVRGRKKK